MVTIRPLLIKQRQGFKQASLADIDLKSGKMGTSDVTSAPYSVFQAALEDIKRLVTIRPDLLQLQCSLSDIGKVIVDRVSILMSADIAASEEENLKDLACLIEMRSKIRESQRPSSSYWPIEVYLDDGGILDCAIKREIVALEASSTSGCAANCMDLVERYAKLVPHLYSYQQNLGSIIANKLKLLSTPACSDNFSDRYVWF